MRFPGVTLPGKFTVTRTKEVHTPCGGLAALSVFLKHLGITRRIWFWETLGDEIAGM